MFIVAGSVQQSPSPLNTTTPSPLRKRMALLSQDDLDLFKGDLVCELIGGTAFYGNVTGACMEDRVRKTKLWNIKFDHGKEEEVTLSQLMGYQKKKYEKYKQYDTQANKKLPATTTTAPTLPASKKKSLTTVEKKK